MLTARGQPFERRPRAAFPACTSRLRLRARPGACSSANAIRCLAEPSARATVGAPSESSDSDFPTPCASLSLQSRCALPTGSGLHDVGEPRRSSGAARRCGAREAAERRASGRLAAESGGATPDRSKGENVERRSTYAKSRRAPRRGQDTPNADGGALGPQRKRPRSGEFPVARVGHGGYASFNKHFPHLWPSRLRFLTPVPPKNIVPPPLGPKY